MFLQYIFSRLVLFVDITRVLSLIVIKPLLEDSLVKKLQLEDSLFYDMYTLLHLSNHEL